MLYDNGLIYRLFDYQTILKYLTCSRKRSVLENLNKI